MKNVIFYFTGTGNSLDAATRIANGIGDCELIDIASWRNAGPVAAERIGFAFPQYYWGMPAAVHGFFAGFRPEGEPYIFCVVTCGNASPGRALIQANQYLHQQGYSINSGFAVVMPNNFLPMYDGPDEKNKKRILDAAHASIAEITETVLNNRHTGLVKPSNPVAAIVARPVNFFFVRDVGKSDRHFTVSSACTGCGKCEAVCGVGNIVLENGTPIWQHHCEQCLGCINVCPVQAIEYGKRTVGRRRYVNPDVTIERNALKR